MCVCMCVVFVVCVVYLCVYVYLLEEGRGEVAALDGHVTHEALLIRFLQDVLLDRHLADQSASKTKHDHQNTPRKCLVQLTFDAPRDLKKLER